MDRKKLETLIREKVQETAGKEAKTKCEGTKKMRKLARENNIWRKHITQQGNENAKTTSEIRVDMKKIEYNFRTKIKCCRLCRTKMKQQSIFFGVKEIKIQ